MVGQEEQKEEGHNFQQIVFSTKGKRKCFKHLYGKNVLPGAQGERTFEYISESVSFFLIQERSQDPRSH